MSRDEADDVAVIVRQLLNAIERWADKSPIQLQLEAQKLRERLDSWVMFRDDQLSDE